MPAKLTQEQYIAKCKEVHGDKYGLSLIKYKTNHEKVTVVCHDHGTFDISAGSFTQGRGCRKCAYESNGEKNHRKVSLESFLERSAEQHGDNYDYSSVDYKNTTTKVIIGCKKCQVYFEMKPELHMIGQGCRACGYEKNGKSRQVSFDKFVEEANKAHGNKFDYSEVAWKGSKATIELFCPVHKEKFVTIPYNHVKGMDCPRCAKERGGMLNRNSHEEFVNAVKEKFGDKFDLSQTLYVKSSEHVKVRCTVHDHWWEVTPNSLLMNGGNCPACNSEAISERSKKTTEEFITDAAKRHNGLYGYDRTEYLDTNSKVEIYCHEHGYFWQNAGYHLQGGGCPVCNNHGYKSHQPGELYVLTDGALTKIGITNKGVDTRCKYISKDSNRDFKVLKSYEFEDGKIPCKIETILLRELGEKCSRPLDKFSGSTECFYDTNQAELFNRIQQLIQEHTDAQQQ